MDALASRIEPEQSSLQGAQRTPSRGEGNVDADDIDWFVAGIVLAYLLFLVWTG